MISKVLGKCSEMEKCGATICCSVWIISLFPGENIAKRVMVRDSVAFAGAKIPTALGAIYWIQVENQGMSSSWP